MKSIKCRICKSNTQFLLKEKVLGRYYVNYYKCMKCEFIQTEDPYWLNMAYSDPIISADTGLIKRNIVLSKITSSLIYCMFKRGEKFLDYGAGYGVLTRLMRDKGFDFYWQDKYSKDLFAIGYEAKKSQKFSVVTAYEWLEHLVTPIEEIENIFTKYNCRALICTTTLYPRHVDKNWWYFIFKTGQHIAFYNKKTLNYIAEKNNLSFYSNGLNIHMFSKDKKNNLVFNGLILLSYLIDIFISLKMKSLTIADHKEQLGKYIK